MPSTNRVGNLMTNVTDQRNSRPDTDTVSINHTEHIDASHSGNVIKYIFRWIHRMLIRRIHKTEKARPIPDYDIIIHLINTLISSCKLHPERHKLQWQIVT